MSLSWEQEPSRPYVTAGRVAGAGLAGLILGAAVGWIWQGAAGSACGTQAQGQAAGFCVPVGQAARGILASFAVICLGVLLAFVLLRVRPRRVTVPIGCIVVAWAVFFTATGFAGGHGPAPWAAAIAGGAGLAAVSLAACARGRVQVSGMIALAVVLLASLVAPRMISRQEQTSAQVGQLTALGFPLELPSLPGFYPSSAYPSNGALVVNMVPDADPTFGIGIWVTIAPAANPGLAEELANCLPRPPRLPCRALRPGQWLITNGNGAVVLAEKAGILAEATSAGNPPVSDAVLVQAASALRPASAAEIAGLG